MLYFAYGSNMDWKQMKERCPSACFVGVAVLTDHRLEFPRASRRRRCGVAGAVPHDGSEVWGAAFEISAVDVGRLDQSEGFRPGREENSYVRRECMVFEARDEERPLTVSTYFATRESGTYRPSRAYLDAILAGAGRWELPAEYIAELARLEIQPEGTP